MAMFSEPSNMKICIIGCGKMGEAILSGWISCDEGCARDLTPESFVVVEHTNEKAAALVQRYGVKAVTALSDAGSFDMVLIAVKPQVIGGVLENLSASFNGDAAPLVVSIAAGITTENIADKLGADKLGCGVRIVRVMPNTPLQVGKGATVVARGQQATEADAEFVRELFGALGYAAIVPESQIDAACALSGGGPAYVAAMIEAMVAAGVNAGLSPELATQLATQTACGTCDLMRETGQTLEQTRLAVCSPGGTTLAALDAMDRAGFAQAVNAGICAAVNRAKELAS